MVVGVQVVLHSCRAALLALRRLGKGLWCCGRDGPKAKDSGRLGLTTCHTALYTAACCSTRAMLICS